jgi:dienelactone hydrolase
MLPLWACSAHRDRGITPDDVKKFGAAMDQLGKKVEVKIYDDAGHAFENPNNKDGYRAADAAWSRAVDFFGDDAEKIRMENASRPRPRARRWILLARIIFFTSYKK